MVGTVSFDEVRDILARHIDKEIIFEEDGDVYTKSLNYELAVSLDPLAQAIGFAMNGIEKTYNIELNTPDGIIDLDTSKYYPDSWLRRAISYYIPLRKNQYAKETSPLYLDDVAQSMWRAVPQRFRRKAD